MDLHPDLARIFYGGHIRGYNRVDTRFFCRIQSAAHILQVFIVKDDIEGEVGLDRGFGTNPDYLLQVFHLEIVGGMRAHIQALHAEINGIGSALDCRLQTFEIACRSHYFQILVLHC